MKPTEFYRVIAKAGPSPVYFFYGQETFLKTKAIKDILKVIPEGQRDFNSDQFYGGETPLAEVLTVARTLPFIAPRRVVIFRDMEKIRLSAADSALLGRYLDDPKPRAREKKELRVELQLLADYLVDPSPQTTLVFTTEADSAGRTWSKKFPSLWTPVDFSPLRGRDLRRAVQEAAKERGVRIGVEAADRLVEAAGSDLGRINQEMEKLAASVGRGEEISVDQVHLLVCGYAYQRMFDLVQAVATRDLAAALKLIDSLFPVDRAYQSAVWQREGPQLMGMLARRLRILRYLAEGGSGKAPGSFRLQKWQLTELHRQAAGFTPGELDAALGELLRIDRLFKSSSVPPRLLLERFLLLFEGEQPLPALSPH